MTQLQYISFILLALYFVGIMVVVLRAKKSTSSEDYFWQVENYRFGLYR